jgi:parallel beta-helix repeat protein
MVHFGQVFLIKMLLQRKQPRITCISMKKSLTLLLILVLTASSIVSVLPVKAKYNGTITIGADGSVNPPISSIQQSGNTYFLTTDIAGNITVQKSNIVLDGNGYKADSVAIGLYTTGISNVTVKNFIINGTSGFAVSGHFSSFGIFVYNGSNVLLTNNTIINTRHPGVFVSTVGIDIVGGSSNKIIGNKLENNSDGLTFSHTQDNIIAGNNVTANHGWFIEIAWGIGFIDSSNNVIFNNNFIDNRGQVYTEDSTNKWDNGEEGNYWSDYTSRHPNATEVDCSGIWYTPFFINEDNIDRFPLTEPVDSELATVLFLHPPEICVSSPKNVTYTTDSVSLNFTVNEATTWMGYSLDGQDNITITENTLNLTGLSDGSHSLTVYATDTWGDTGTSETIYFKIDTTSTTGITIAIVITAVVGVAILAYFLKIKKTTKPE